VDVKLKALRSSVVAAKPSPGARVQTVHWPQALLAELLPGRANRDITTGQPKTMLDTVRPRDVADKTRCRIAAKE
jgi:hypothetical protein